MIKELRIERGLTQKDLAKKIGRSESYVQKLEEDFVGTDPNIRLLSKLAIAFDTDPKQFVFDILKTYYDCECVNDTNSCKKMY